MKIYETKKLVFLLLGFLTACSSVEQSAIIENNQSIYYGKEGKFRFVKLQGGETINEIAEKYNVPIREIKKFNSYDNIKVGQIIKVPIGNYYLVKEDDTLKNIARVHDVDLNLLAEANGLSAKSEIYTGDYIKIPETKTGFAESKENQHIDFESSEVYDSDSDEKDGVNDMQIEGMKEALTATGTVSIAPKSEIRTKFFKNNTPINSKDFIWPVYGKVIQGYGDHNGKFNEGINIAANKGTVIKAAAKGQVAYVGNQKEYGNLIIIRHNNGYMTAYTHVDKILVKRGQIINQGVQIATVGSSGNVDIPQLQFSMKKGNHTINPDG